MAIPKGRESIAEGGALMPALVMALGPRDRFQPDQDPKNRLNSRADSHNVTSPSATGIANSARMIQWPSENISLM